MVKKINPKGGPGILSKSPQVVISKYESKKAGNALAQVQRVHEPVDLWGITYCTRIFWGFRYYWNTQGRWSVPASSDESEPS